MTLRPIQSVATAMFLAALVLPAVGQVELPELKEVMEVVRSRATGISDSDLNRAAVLGLVSELSPRVQLITNNAPSATNELTITRTDVFDGQIGYVRIARVGSQLPQALRDAFQQLASSNKLSGLVLDLRYASGSDYPSSAAVADLFIASERPLLKWENEVLSTKQKGDAIQLPLAILVNNGTSGAAETLAGALRAGGAGLILGSRTAGQAFVTRDFPLKNGVILRVGAYPVSLADGTPVSTNGVKPDIDVTINPEQERAYYADAFSLIRGTNSAAASGITNKAMARGGRLDEAQLVRQHRAGLRRSRDADDDSPDQIPDALRNGNASRTGESERPLVSDPALARALDLLKGLAVVRQSRL